ncbi:MAG: RNA polymerase sigma-70 factor [Sphingobacteriaceae bacterium]|nr:RNA polymerase sigma-70 factor [Sphingobacteriaceae bacterium]
MYGYYHKKLIAFSSTYTKSKELAEEIVEDVFVKLWFKREAVAEITNLNVYLYTAIKHQSLNALSKEARRVVTELLEVTHYTDHSEYSSPHDLLVTSELMQSVQSAIDSLPPRCKLIFQLVREDQLRYKEIAEILNISVNTIDTQMAIAVKRLCSALNIPLGNKAIKLFEKKR